MNVERTVDFKKINEIASKCGSNSVKETIAILRRMHFYSPSKFKCEIIDGVAFWAATMGKKHMRLYEIAVREDKQKNGYGRYMMYRMVSVCKQYGLEKITFRTSKKETAVEFYKRIGAVVIGEKGEDWEMELKV